MVERWVESARRGALFGVSGLEALDAKGVAEHVTLALAARSGRKPGEDLAAAAFRGAAIAS